MFALRPRAMSRAVSRAWLPAAVFAWQGLLLAQAQVAPAAVSGGQVSVDIVGLHSDRGRVLAALYRGEAGFPSKIKQAFARKVAVSKARQLRIVFENVPAGEFAVSMFHDENANNTLDTNFMGIPKEGWGTSRDAKASFGPPSYADARLTLARGEHKRILVHVQY
jgi:uncharacterized protein (DUF2141 family)